MNEQTMCTEIRELLQRGLDAPLPAAAARQVQEHCGTCPDCAQVGRRLHRLSDSLLRLAARDSAIRMPVQLRQNILAALPEDTEQQRTALEAGLAELRREPTLIGTLKNPELLDRWLTRHGLDRAAAGSALRLRRAEAHAAARELDDDELLEVAGGCGAPAGSDYGIVGELESLLGLHDHDGIV
ncbi:MAG TPA: zf-HC2 domain-containing protein [bacterium]|nr:zf-HC2 domain-containing protein [bacterium]